MHRKSTAGPARSVNFARRHLACFDEVPPREILYFSEYETEWTVAESRASKSQVSVINRHSFCIQSGLLCKFFQSNLWKSAIRIESVNRELVRTFDTCKKEADSMVFSPLGNDFGTISRRSVTFINDKRLAKPSILLNRIEAQLPSITVSALVSPIANLADKSECRRGT